MASLGLGIRSLMGIDLAREPVVRTFLQELVKVQCNAPKEVEDFILNKQALSVPIIIACALFMSTKVDLGSPTIPEREVLRDAYFISAIWSLL